jgi:hypothetical protein
VSPAPAGLGAALAAALVDRDNVPMLPRMFTKRLRGHLAIGY